MSDLLALAERCEAAEGPDREIDCLIRETLDPRFKPEDRVTYYGQPTGHVDWSDDRSFVDSPAYTASLDVALTLYLRVPERVPSNSRLAAAEALRQRAEDV